MTEQEWSRMRKSIEDSQPKARRKLHPCSLVGPKRRADGVEGPLPWTPPSDPLAGEKPAVSWDDADGKPKKNVA